MTGQLGFWQSPYFWFFLAAFFLGAGLSRATKRIRKTTDLEKMNFEQARNRKWVWVCIYLSLAVSLALCGIIFPDLKQLSDLKFLIFFVCACGFFFLIFRFKKSIGIPVALLLCMCILFLGLFLQSLVSFTGETKICDVKVLDVKNKQLKLELNVKGQNNKATTEIIYLKGDYFSPLVKLIIFDDFFVFLGAKTWYRFLGVSAFYEENEKFKQSETSYYFPKPIGINNWVYHFFEHYQEYIPGVKSVKVEFSLTRVKEQNVSQLKDFDAYSIWIQNDGGIQIVKEKNKNKK